MQPGKSLTWNRGYISYFEEVDIDDTSFEGEELVEFQKGWNYAKELITGDGCLDD